MIDYAAEDTLEKPAQSRSESNDPPNSARLGSTGGGSVRLDTAGLVELVRAIAAPCSCELGESRRREECEPPIDRLWLLESLLSEDQILAFERFHAQRVA